MPFIGELERNRVNPMVKMSKDIAFRVIVDHIVRQFYYADVQIPSNNKLARVIRRNSEPCSSLRIHLLRPLIERAFFN